MSSKRQVSLVLLCEDHVHEVFIRRYLEKAGYDVSPRKLRVFISPSGRGSAEQFIRRRYPDEVRAFRKRNPEYWGLIVGIDSDTQTVEFRVKQLSNVLDSNDLTPREKTERIVLLIPRRNIETWIYFLLGNSDVDEEENYKSIYKGMSDKNYCRSAAHELWNQLNSGNSLLDEMPESLVVAIQELNRLKLE